MLPSFSPRLKYVFLTCVLITICVLTTPLQAQVLAYSFDESGGSTAINSGTLGAGSNLTMLSATGAATDLHSATSSGGINGPGGSGDQSMNLTAATGMGSGFGGPYASSPSAGNAFANAQSLTIAGWYNAASTVGGGARFLQSGNVILFANPNTLVLQLNANITGTSAGTVVGSSATFVSTSGGTLTTPSDQWVFFAITLDGTGTNKTMTFFQGDTNPGSTMVSRSVTFTTTGTLIGNVAGLSVGSNTTSGTNVRPFDGSFDDFAVWTSSADASAALSATEINNFRVATAVPEPTLGVLLAGGLTVLAPFRRRRLRAE